jgi:hypothetical protein
MEVSTMTNADDAVVTEATWKPGLPPPIEALQAAFPGCVVEYGTWLERDQTDASGWRHTPIAIVTMPDGRETTFFPTAPHTHIRPEMTPDLTRRAEPPDASPRE